MLSGSSDRNPYGSDAQYNSQSRQARHRPCIGRRRADRRNASRALNLARGHCRAKHFRYTTAPRNNTLPSSSGLGHRPLKAGTRVRTSLGAPLFMRFVRNRRAIRQYSKLPAPAVGSTPDAAFHGRTSQEQPARSSDCAFVSEQTPGNRPPTSVSRDGAEWPRGLSHRTGETPKPSTRPVCNSGGSNEAISLGHLRLGPTKKGGSGTGRRPKPLCRSRKREGKSPLLLQAKKQTTRRNSRRRLFTPRALQSYLRAPLRKSHTP